MPTLVLSPRYTSDSQRLWRAAGRLGWDVERLTSLRVPPELQSLAEPVLHAEALIAHLLAEQLGIDLLEPDDDWLPRLPDEHRKRWVRPSTLGAVRTRDEPAFIKPAKDKSFAAGVYRGGDLPSEFDDDSPVLVAEIVEWEAEFRVFVLDRLMRAVSIYLRNGVFQEPNEFAHSDAEVEQVRDFVGRLLGEPSIPCPRAIVVDVGIIRDRGWAVVEANPAWGAGMYGCDSEAVLAVLRAASVRTPRIA